MRGPTSRIRSKLTYANVTATIALFLALGGATAIAANQLPKHSVGTPQLKAKAVKAGQLARNAVKTGKIAPEAVKAGKIDKGAIVTNRLRDGAVSGAKVASGAVGTGKLADDSVTGPKVKESTLGQVPSAADADRVGGHSASCPAGMSAVAGLCFDSGARPNDDFPGAFADCAGEGLMLPSPAQLAAAAATLGNVATGDGEWTDSFYFVPPSENRALGVNDEGGATSFITTSFLPYRCVTQLVR